MRNHGIFAMGAAACALSAVITSPVLAEGKKDRAREAIAAASAKIDAANKVGATGEVPRLQAEAQASLRTAQEDLDSGRKDDAIAEANHAAELADTAIGVAHRAQLEQERANSQAAASQAAAAQADAAAANARADAASQTAAAAQADAAAARAAPPPAPVVIAAAPPQPTTTTVTTETTAKPVAKARVTHRVVRRTTRPSTSAATAQTTTTVTTDQN